MPAMLAAVSASTLAASVLDSARSGRPPAAVVIDVEHVALAARSERYARVAGSSSQADPFAPLSRFWATADGWLRLHANYPWHRARALEVLGCRDEPDAVAHAIRSWRGEDLESALARGGGAGFAVRSLGEWRVHPQGRAVAGLPLLHGVSGPGPGRPLGVGRAARGARVLDLTRVIAGPVATRTLAAWGAEVLRLDSPQLPELPAQAIDTMPGKRSALLDFSEPTGRARLGELLDAAHIVVQGYRPGALARFGLSVDALATRWPHLCVVTLSAWGTAGPWAGWRGFDSLVQCPTGIAVAEGGYGRPGALPAQVLDHATGYLAAAAGLLALAGVERGEQPRSYRLSLAQTAHWLTGVAVRERDPPRDQSPDRHLVGLTGGSRPVEVIGPPGRLHDLAPAWATTTEFGVDPPRFRSAATVRR
jgi:CoA transferase family III